MAMERTKHLMIWAILLLLGGPVVAQYDCTDYHKFNCERSGDIRFSLNGQSKSASVQVGVATELNIIVYRGQDYRITFCFDEKIIGDHVVFRLIEKIREPRAVDVEEVSNEDVLDANGQATGETREVRKTVTKTEYDETRKVLYDNTEHEMAQEVEFSSTSTKRLVVEVMAPGVEEPKGRGKGMDIGCVGILIEHMPTPAIGF